MYILETKGPEYRVVYTQAIDNIYGTFNEEKLSWSGDSEMLLEYFGSSEAFTDMNEALEYAGVLEDQHEYLEDGVCIITDFKEKEFKELINE